MGQFLLETIINAQCSEDEFDPFGEYKRRAETKAVCDMEINSSNSDSDFCFDSKAKHNSWKTNKCGQSQKTVVATKSERPHGNFHAFQSVLFECSNISAIMVEG